jgi:hypothetical protein
VISIYLQCLKDIECFADQTHELIMNKIDEFEADDYKQYSFERRVKYNFQIISHDSNLEFLDPEFEFWANDEFEVLKNLLIDKKVLDDNSIEMVLAGTNRQIKAYYSCLKYARKKGNINLIVVVIVVDDINKLALACKANKVKKKKRKKKSIYIEKDVLKVIRKLLPEQPWESGVHKNIAEKLGLNNKVVSQAIKILMDRGDFKQQKDGVFVEDEKNDP